MVFLAADPRVGNITGKYFQEKHVVESSPASHDRGAAERLWSLSQDLTNLENLGARALQYMGRSATVAQ